MLFRSVSEFEEYLNQPVINEGWIWKDIPVPDVVDLLQSPEPMFGHPVGKTPKEECSARGSSVALRQNNPHLQTKSTDLGVGRKRDEIKSEIVIFSPHVDDTAPATPRDAEESEQLFLISPSEKSIKNTASPVFDEHEPCVHAMMAQSTKS